jgi:DNA-binding transcriptional LysR family regulator
VHHALCDRKEIEWADLRKEHLIVRQSEYDHALCDRLTRRFPDPNRGAMQKLNIGRETMMHLVAMGLGISFTTEAAIVTPFPKVVFRPIARNDELLQFSAAWLPHNDNPALRRFLSLARTLAKDRHHFGASAALLGSAVIAGLFTSFASAGAIARRLGLSS